MKKVNPVKIYWEEFPENVDQFKNVLNPANFQEPSKVLNSTEVMVHPKPWLKKDVRSGAKSRSLNVYDTKNTDVNKSCQKESVVITKNPQTLIRIKDLDPEDKQKIANLIRELAKFGNEKEVAIKELSHVKQNFNNLQRQLHSEKEMAVKEYDALKQKLLEYEILVEEMKHKSLQQEPLQKRCTDVGSIDGKSETSLIDNFSDLFLEQEKKFQHQQNILQEQIEQLQRLQESVLKVQTVNNTPAAATPKKVSKESSCLNTKKLESYLQSSSKKNSQIEHSTIDKSLDLSSQSKQYNGVTNRSTVDMEVQTEPNKMEDETPIVVEDSYKNHRKIAGSIERDDKKYYGSYTQGYNIHNKTSFQNKQTKRTLYKKAVPQKSVGFSTKLPLSTFSQSSDDEEVDEEAIVISPLQRKHFKPSSMLELVEGIQPRSTSTSVDQYSLKQSFASSLRATTGKGGQGWANGSKTGTKSKIEKVYQQKMLSTIPKSKNERQHNEEMLERALLDDVFFM